MAASRVGGRRARAPAARPARACSPTARAPDIVVRRSAFGRQVDSFELAVRGVDRPMHAVLIRVPWVERSGERVEMPATVPDVPTARGAAGRIVAVAQRSALATAFHPELTRVGAVRRRLVELVRPH